MEQMPKISLGYSTLVAIITMFTPQEFEIYVRIFMYLSAAALSIVSIYYLVKTKGKSRKF